MTCGWVLHPSALLTLGVFMAAGVGFVITVLGILAMTVCTGWTWLLLH